MLTGNQYSWLVINVCGSAMFSCIDCAIQWYDQGASVGDVGPLGCVVSPSSSAGHVTIASN